MYSIKLLEDKKINVNKKFGVIIFFILIDLFMSNNCTSTYMTISKSGEELPKLPKGVQCPEYPIHRMWELKIPYGPLNRFSFEPIIFKKHIANMPFTTIFDFRFIELSNYNTFKKYRILPDIRDIIMGIKQPILRLVPKCVVIKHDEIITALENIDVKTINHVVFLEENLPDRFKHLTVGVDEIKKDMSISGDIKVLDYKENEILLTVDTEQDAVLYFSDSYDIYWEAYIDGSKTKIYKANLNFKAILVERGRHKVHFLYNPRFYRFSFYVYIFTFIVILILIIFKKYVILMLRA